MTNQISSMIPIGKIVGVHGIKGFITVKSFTQNPEDIFTYAPLYSKDGQKIYELTLKHPKKGVFVCACNDIKDRNGAEALKGIELYMMADQLPEAGEDEYYHSDLIGLHVQNMDGAVIGTVQAMHNYGAGDIVEINYHPDHKTDTSQDMLLFNKETVPDVNIKDGYIIINPQDVV